MAKVILLRQNTAAIRKAIKRAGIKMCVCCTFKKSCWLDYYAELGDVHGVGYPFEGMTSEATLAMVEYEWKKYNTEVVECKNVGEFIENIKEEQRNAYKESSETT